MAEKELQVRFWGVRGSIACPGDSHRRYGGNTSCLEVTCGARKVIFDAGSGLRPLGVELAASGEPLHSDIFLSHTHHDHIVGLPFFAPLFDRRNEISVWAGHLLPAHNLDETMCKFMTAPLFPVPPQIFSAKVEWKDFTAGATLQLTPEITLRTAPINHPNGATAYRLDYAGKSLCYVTDTEHRPGGLDQTILELIKGTDLFIYDSTYTDEEYPRYHGWGHSTWQEGVRLANAGKVKSFAVFHHDPGHDDIFMDQVAKELKALRPASFVAREGQTLTL